MYSSAFNNTNLLSGSADPQTGLFSFSHNFGTLFADRGFGPGYDMVMNFNALSTLYGAGSSPDNTSGLGRGWDFSLSRYNRSAQSLTTMTGETYSVLFASPTSPWELSHKLEDIQVVQQGQELFIYHKDGSFETLNIDSATQNATASRYTSPTGRYIAFDYNQVSGYDRLTRIYDSGVTLATVAYENGAGHVTVTLYPGTTEQRVVTLDVQGDGVLYHINLPEAQRIELEYDTVGFNGAVFLSLLKQVRYPTGATEVVDYEGKLYLPDGAPIPYLPAVTRHAKTISSQHPPVVTTFAYEQDPDGQPGNNFWGYHAGVNWQDNTDNLWDYASTYYYTSETRVGDKHCTYRYNKFHQLLAVVETNGSDSHQKITRLSYLSDDAKPLAAQGKQYELLSQQTTTFVVPGSPVSQDFVKTYEYDDAGNITREKDLAGVQTLSAYYSADGDVGCPAHPFGMVSFVRERTILACDGSESKVIRFTYRHVSNAYGNAEACIVLDTSTYQDYRVEHDYFDGESSTIQAELKQRRVIFGDSVTSETHDYAFTTETVVETITQLGFDGQSAFDETETSRYSGRTVSQTDAAGVTTRYSYDPSGRPLTQIQAAGSDYAVTTTVAYTNAPSMPEGDLVIGTRVVIESQGVESHHYYDAEQKELFRYLPDEQGALRRVSAKEYDNQGRETATTVADFTLSAGGADDMAAYTDTTRSRYGVWGEVCETAQGDGTISVSHFDPLTLSILQQVVRRDDLASPDMVTSAVAPSISTFDLFGNPLRQQTLTLEGDLYSETLSDYDGFGRRIRQQMPSGAVLSVGGYDGFDRPVSTTHADGTQHAITYSPLSASPTRILATVIDGSPLSNLSLGERTFDGLGRLTRRSVNGVTRQYRYTGGYPAPTTVLNGREQATVLTYIPELGKPSRVATYAGASATGSALSESVFEFATTDSLTPTGLLATARNQLGAYHYTYTQQGIPDTVTQSVDGLPDHLTTHAQYTLLGQSESITLGDTRQMRVSRDTLGRLTATVDGDVRTEVQRDLFGRISVMDVYVDDTLQQVTSLRFDEHGREIERLISVTPTGDTTLINSEYDTEHRLVMRQTQVNDNQSLAEHFTYDSRGRLVTYHIDDGDSAGLLPRDEQGRALTAQTFSYDGLNNLLTLTTTYLNGDINTGRYSYDVQRLTAISNSLVVGENAHPAQLTLSHDNDGNLVSVGGSGIALTYTVANRVASYQGAEYSYDAFNRLLRSEAGVRHYLSNEVVEEVQAGERHEFVRHGGVPVVERWGGEHQLLATDSHRSVVAVTQGSTTAHTQYTPAGSGGAGNRLGFNGELKDASGGYLLGNGTRLYLPALGMFSSLDSLSPFSGGGLNPYRYCSGDPINLADPSGHMSAGQAGGIAGIFAGVVGILFALPTGGASLSLTAAAAIGLEMAGIAASTVALSKSSGSGSEENGGVSIAGAVAIVALTAAGMGMMKFGKGPFNCLKRRKGNSKIPKGAKLISVDESTSPQIVVDEGLIYSLEIDSSTNSSTSRYILKDRDNKPLEAKGEYLYVIRPETPDIVRVMREPMHGLSGHSSMTGPTTRGPVLFAGELNFDDTGNLIMWNNKSGHYLPDANLRYKNLTPEVQHLLPDDLFKQQDMWGNVRL